MWPEIPFSFRNTVDLTEFNKVNKALLLKETTGGRKAIILGITELATNSFLSAASFRKQQKS